MANTTTRATRACDGCRFRKVKCNGASPCSQCAHLALKCTTSSVPRQRKVGARGRLVQQLRQGGTNAASSAIAASEDAPRDADHHAADGPSPHGGSILSDSVASPMTPVPGKSPYSSDFFVKLLPEFDEVVYPVHPIITSVTAQRTHPALRNSKFKF